MNKNVLITGASGGIGLELARIHARHGDNLILIARSQDKLMELKTEILKKHNMSVHIFAKDLAAENATSEIFNELESESVKIDYLINNAGFGHYGEFVNNHWEKEKQMIELNITALTHLTKLFLPGMIERGYGRIMNVASVAGFFPGPLMAVYYATKAFVLSFSEALNSELDKTGVSVTALCPGPTLSGFQEAASVKGVKLFEHKGLPTSAQVAEYGYKAMIKGKTVAIHGIQNLLMVTSVRFVPRNMVSRIVKMVQGRKKQSV